MDRHNADIKFRAACMGAEVKDSERFLTDEELMRQLDAIVAAQNGKK